MSGMPGSSQHGRRFPGSTPAATQNFWISSTKLENFFQALNTLILKGTGSVSFDVRGGRAASPAQVLARGSQGCPLMEGVCRYHLRFQGFRESL